MCHRRRVRFWQPHDQRPDTGPATPPPAGALASFAVHTESGVEIDADIWFRAYGIAPVTDYLAGDPAQSRTLEGYIEVAPTMELPGQGGIFAVGDIAAGHPNGAGRAGRHGDLVAANIRTIITGEGAIAEAPVTPPAIILPLGPEGRPGERPTQQELLGPSEVAAIIGRDMMVDRYAEKLGVLQPIMETN